VQLHIVLLPKKNWFSWIVKAEPRAKDPIGELTASRDKWVEPSQLSASTARDVGVVDVDVGRVRSSVHYLSCS